MKKVERKDGIWINRLSLDAVLVAVIWTFALIEIRGGLVGLSHLVVMALATWLTYVGDHLLDVTWKKQIPSTGRHEFYYRHRNILLGLWVFVFVASIIVAVKSLQAWKLFGGGVLLLSILLYFFLMHLVENGLWRSIGKRVIVSLIYTFGIYWMAEAWRDLSSLWGVIILWTGCLANLFVITKWEDDSAAARNAGKLLGWFFVAVLAVVGLSIPRDLDGLYYASLAGVYQFTLLNLLPADMGIERRRFLADLILLTMGMIVIAVGHT